MRARKKTGRPSCAAALALAFALAAPASALGAEVEFIASVDADEVSVDETLTLTVTASLDAGTNDTEDVRLPEAPDFEVLSRSQSQQMSFSMGHGAPTFRKVRVFKLILQPRHAGTFTIKPARLTFHEKTYETLALRVKVTNAKAGNKRARPAPAQQGGPPPASPFGNLGGLFGGDDEDAQDLLQQLVGGSRPASDSDLFLRTVVDKKQAYLGEQITFSTLLFSRVDVSDLDGIKMPRLDGFWAEDMETPRPIVGELKMIDGVPYRVYLLNKRALFPLKAGKLTIDPVELDVSTGFGFVIHGGKMHRVSQALSVEVLALPAGAPAGFETPNVGAWRLGGEARPTATALGQPITFTLTLEGSGNLHDVVVARLPAIPGFKIYDPTINEKTSVSKGRFGGKRTLEYLMMPEQTGRFELPAVAMSYFDPASRQYLTASTQAVVVHVEGGAGGPTVVSPGAPIPSGDEHRNILDASGLRPLRYKADLVQPKPPMYRRPFFLPVALAPVALWLAFVGFALVRSTLRPSAEGVLRERAGKARRRLRTARSLFKARKPDAFYAEVSRALNDYLSARLSTPAAGLTRADLSARLGARGLAPETVTRLCAVLDTCDAGRFAPGGNTSQSMERLLDEAITVIEILEGARLPPPPAEARS